MAYPINGNYPGDAVMNSVILHGEMIDLFCMSVPGDQLIMERDGMFIVEKWAKDRPQRDKQYRNLVRQYELLCVCWNCKE